MRTGDEPSHARSPLRLRLSLAVFGLGCAIIGCAIFAALDATGWLIASIALGLVAIADMVIVLSHIHAGAHYQPGRGIPPYQPVTEDPAARRPEQAAVPIERRRGRYLALMAMCVFLFVSSWTWVRLYSPAAALGMSLVAMVLPPIAAIVANAGRRPGR
ncbi:MAG TPA: DUF6343 family protein [Actinomycetes bacterium]|nr:DUF6343 family protein [Actinomycetes bacterium]